MCMYFKTKAEDHSLGKKIWGWKNGSFVYAELNETVEAPTSIYSATGKFLRFIFSALVAKNYQIIRSSVLVYKFCLIDIFKIPFVMAEASYCYYEKVRRTMRIAIVSFVLKYFYSFSAVELNNIESEGEVFV